MYVYIVICRGIYGTYLASGKTSSPENARRFCRRSLSRIVVSALCSQQSAMTAVTRPSSSFSSYALMKWNVTYSGTSTLVTFGPIWQTTMKTWRKYNSFTYTSFLPVPPNLLKKYTTYLQFSSIEIINLWK